MPQNRIGFFDMVHHYFDGRRSKNIYDEDTCFRKKWQFQFQVSVSNFRQVSYDRNPIKKYRLILENLSSASNRVTARKNNLETERRCRQ